MQKHEDQVVYDGKVERSSDQQVLDINKVSYGSPFFITIFVQTIYNVPSY